MKGRLANAQLSGMTPLGMKAVLISQHACVRSCCAKHGKDQNDIRLLLVLSLMPMKSENGGVEGGAQRQQQPLTDSWRHSSDKHSDCMRVGMNACATSCFRLIV